MHQSQGLTLSAKLSPNITRSAVAGVAVLAALVLGVGVIAGLRSLNGGSDASPVDQGGATNASGAPSEPAAKVCGSDTLDGPTSPPDGARTVTPEESLTEAVHESPANTTFWLAPGQHQLGSGQYDQVTPKDGDTFVGAPDAVLDGRHVNRYAFGGHATEVTIEHLTIQNFGKPETGNNEGVVNHDTGHDWVIRHNSIRRNAGAGVMIGDGSVVEHNCLSSNGQYGFSAYEPDGVDDVVVSHNEIVGNNADDWEKLNEGCGCTGGGKFWVTRGAEITENWIHDNRGPGIWADTNNTQFLIKGNDISDNDSEGLIYEISYNAKIVDNVFARNGLVRGPAYDGFPVPALYISESGSDPRAGAKYGEYFEIADNLFVDNWSALIAWESADRFAGSPANTSTGVSTLVNPDVATVRNCRDPDKIKKKPYYDDCRWKTKNLSVHDNTFKFDPGHIGSACTPEAGCGYVGLISAYGTYPDWSPYKKMVVADRITFDQHNAWSSNRYLGPWRFMIHDLWNAVSWVTWRSKPYNQDENSTLSRHQLQMTTGRESGNE